MENRNNWEQSVVEKLATESLREQRHRRRWSVFFRLIAVIYFGFLIYALFFKADLAEMKQSTENHVALIDIIGVIQVDGEVDANNVIESLQEAFEDNNTKAVMLRINSPGGSPVQAGIINDEIKRLKKLHKKIPVYAVIEDICASGGYYVAVAADKIYADKASIIGSIGVIMDGFGFTGLMEKVGVERRLLTAGENKGLLDPFSPVNEQQQVFVKDMLNKIHEQFITVVRQGRGNRLHESPELFSGLVWSGEQSVSIGLIDGLGSVDSVARDIVGVDNIVDFSSKKSVLDRFADRVGVSAAHALGTKLGMKLQ